jgi:biopolymer transport protein ExbD
MSRYSHRNSKKRFFEEPAVNLTPLIDVVFVILIMFILVAPLLELDRIELAKAPNKQESNKIETHENSPINIHVQENNLILLNKEQISINDLNVLLKKMKKNYPKSTPQLFHDKRAYFGTYQLVKNAVEEAGFERMDVILNPT